VLSYCSRKIQDFFTLSGKRKREDFASQYHPGGFIPQQDGAGDAASEVFEIEVCPLVFLVG
jgi:transcription initiation factor TFIIA large subunit